jgi:hypothetical protein
MISFDLECASNHRFEGVFKDYQAFESQLTKSMIECPICQDSKIKRLFTGCSIQSGSSVPVMDNTKSEQNPVNVFEMIKILREYVVKNFDNVGNNFADTAKAMYYGIEKERNIYGESTPAEIKELIDEGIDVLPIPSIDKIEN